MGLSRMKAMQLVFALSIVAMVCLSKAPISAAASYTKYATTADTDSFGDIYGVLGPPDGVYEEDLIEGGGYILGGGFGTGSGTITEVIIGVRYQVDVPAVDDTLTLKYSLDGGATFGSASLVWIPTDTDWAEKSLDITSDNSVNDGSWDWSDIKNLQIWLQCTPVGAGDQSMVRVDSFSVFLTTSAVNTQTSTSPPIHSFDFSLSTLSSKLSVQRSDSVSTTIEVKLVTGFPKLVLLSGVWVGTPPSGVVPILSQLSGVPDFSTTLTFSTNPEGTVGSFTYQVKGISGTIVKTLDITINITELMSPAPPMLLYPDDGVALDTVTPTFDWADIVASTYNLEIATDREFTHVILTKITMESTATLSQHEALSYGTTYYWRVRGANAAGVGEWSPTRSFIAKVAAPKVLGLRIAEGAQYVNTSKVQLSISAINAAQISFSTDGIAWGAWEEFQPTKIFELPPSDGPKNVYVRVRDAAGDIGQSVLASVVLDQTPPTTRHFLLGSLEDDAYRSSVAVILSAADPTAGILETRYRIDNGEWMAGNTFIIAKDGRHTVEYYSVDRAGNSGAVNSFAVTIFTPTTLPPAILQYWWAIFGAAAAVAVVATLVYRRLRIARRLKQIRQEKAELPNLKREAEIKYFKEGTISRETYDKLIEEYERRRAELEKEEKLLLERLRKRGGKKA
ncbi:MAG: OmpL47-type beta-barrel domain-containing protein [Candidatus Hadarchaeaceae archaeon]